MHLADSAFGVVKDCIAHSGRGVELGGSCPC